MKKLIAIMLVGLMFVPMARAEIVIDNSTFDILEDSTQSCFKDSLYGLTNYNMEIQPDSKCIGVNFISPPSYCQRKIRIRNPTHESFPIGVQIIPIPDNLPCPATTYTNNRAYVRFNPSSDTTAFQHNIIDLNDCWNWWCENTSYVVERICPFGWDALHYLGPLSGCWNMNVTVENPMEQCPVVMFTVQPEDLWVDIQMEWVNNPPNDIDTPYILKIKGYTTDYRSKTISTLDNKTLSAGVSSYISGMETILNVNMNILGLLYLIFEIIAITVAILGIPTLVIVLIRWGWETVTNRPFGFPKRRRR